MSQDYKTIRTKVKKIVLIITILILTTSCRKPDSFGFYQPITLSLKVPDGPAEYQAGWYAGCRSGLAQKAFANAAVYLEDNHGPNMGNGIYQHDPAFQTGWGQGWFACILHVGSFTADQWRSFKYAPLN
ncbi:MAG: hypothetical protein KGQ36_03095 [Rickettsiales bacterium]|nr:hypothetical protein [Rickettsiales bacterium]